MSPSLRLLLDRLLVAYNLYRNRDLDVAFLNLLLNLVEPTCNLAGPPRRQIAVEYLSHSSSVLPFVSDAVQNTWMVANPLNAARSRGGEHSGGYRGHFDI